MNQDESELGSVPEGWKVVSLGSLGRIGNGSTPRKTVPAYWDGGTYPWLTSAKMYDRDIVAADQFVTAKALEECHLPRLKPGAVLIAITGQGKTLGHCAVLKTEATISQHVAYVATDTGLADPSFVRSYLETKYDYLRQVASGSGSTKGALTCAFLRDLAIPLPPIDEQRAIARVIDHVAGAVSREQRSEERALALKSAAMHELFTRGLRGEPQKDTTAGFIPESWDVVPLGSIGRIGNGSTPKKTISAYWDGGTYPWLTSAKVYDRDVTAADQFVTTKALEECHLPRVDPGAVLIAITGQGKTLGHCAVLRFESTVSQHVAYVAVQHKLADSSFVRGYLETRYEYLRQVASGGGSTKGALTCAFLRDLHIPLPDLDEQREIVAILDAIDRKISLHKRKRLVLEDLFKSLLHKLMTGEIRVSDLDLAALPPPSPVPHPSPEPALL